MDFEFDPAKSAANKQKHGIDFVTAQELWQDIDRTEVPARSAAEKRKLLIARLGGKLWTAVFTERGRNVRLISVAAPETKNKELMSRQKTKTKTTAANLEARFDAGEVVSDYFDFSRATRPGHKKSRVNVDFPIWMIRKLDLVAGRHGIAQQALIKTWLAERLKAEAA
jgi:uncharacterized protein